VSGHFTVRKRLLSFMNGVKPSFMNLSSGTNVDRPFLNMTISTFLRKREIDRDHKFSLNGKGLVRRFQGLQTLQIEQLFAHGQENVLKHIVR